jgi:hypothetical protein
MFSLMVALGDFLAKIWLTRLSSPWYLKFSIQCLPLMLFPIVFVCSYATRTSLVGLLGQDVRVGIVVGFLTTLAVVLYIKTIIRTFLLDVRRSLISGCIKSLLETWEYRSARLLILPVKIFISIDMAVTDLLRQPPTPFEFSRTVEDLDVQISMLLLHILSGEMQGIRSTSYRAAMLNSSLTLFRMCVSYHSLHSVPVWLTRSTDFGSRVPPQFRVSI